MTFSPGLVRHTSTMTADNAATIGDRSGLVVTEAAKAFGSRSLWRHMSFNVPSGRIMALTGASGSGKSTLLNCLGLLDNLDSGSISLDGEVMSSTTERRRRRFRRDQLGYLFQNYALIDNATVYENLNVVTGSLGIRKRTRRADYDDALLKVGLKGRGSDFVFRLSGGEQQRVAVARLLVKRPSLVLADEPTGALDSDNVGAVLGFLREMANSGCTIVIATHSREVADRCDLSLDPPARFPESVGLVL